MGNTQGNANATPAASQDQKDTSQIHSQADEQQQQQQQVEFNYSEKDLEYLESKEMDDAYGEIRIYRIKNSAPEPNPEDPERIVEDLEICTKTKIFDTKDDCIEYFNDIDEKKRLIHPHLVRLIKCNTTTSSNFCTNIHKVDMAFEFIKHSLETEILNRFKTKEYFDESSIFDLIEQVLSCLYYLGSNGVTHGDIQPRTILIDNYANFKITDIRFLTSGMCGYRKHLAGIETECFLAPELLQKLRRQTIVDNEEIDQQKADVFSLGLVALAMSTLQNVDVVYDFDEYLLKEEEIQNLLEIVKQSYSHSLFLLLTSMLNHVDRRLDIENALNLIDQMRSDQFNSDEYEKLRFQSDLDNDVDGSRKTEEQQGNDSRRQSQLEEIVKRSNPNQQGVTLEDQITPNAIDEKALLLEQQKLEEQRRAQQLTGNQSPQQKTNQTTQNGTQQQQNGQSQQPVQQALPFSNPNRSNYTDVEGRVRDALMRSQQVSMKFENSPLRLFRDQLLADELYVPLDPQQASTSSYVKSRNQLEQSGRKNASHLGNSNVSIPLQQTQPKHIVYQPTSSQTYQMQKNLTVSKRVQNSQQSQRQQASKKWKI